MVFCLSYRPRYLDELLFEVNLRDLDTVKAMLTEKACSVAEGDMGVPLKVRFKVGNNWGSMKNDR